MVLLYSENFEFTIHLHIMIYLTSINQKITKYFFKDYSIFCTKLSEQFCGSEEKKLFILYLLHICLEDQIQKNKPIREYASTKIIVL